MVSYDFLFDCSYYANMRYTLLQNLSLLPSDCVSDLKFWPYSDYHSWSWYL